MSLGVEFLGKTFKLEKDEGFQDYLKGKGVGMVKRKMIQAFSPTKTFAQDGEFYTVTTGTPKGKVEARFKSGETVKVNFLDGSAHDIKFTIVDDGQTLVEEEEGQGGTEVRKYSVHGDLLHMDLSLGDMTARRIFKKI